MREEGTVAPHGGHRDEEPAGKGGAAEGPASADQAARGSTPVGDQDRAGGATLTCEPSGDPRGGPARGAVRYGWVLAVVVGVQFMVTLDASVVNVALPAMRDELGFTEAGLLWVVNAYTLVFGGFLLLGGRAADLFGRRRALWLGLALFGLASLAGGLAQTPQTLVAARAVQGLGAAVLAPVALTIVTTVFPASGRARALGLWSAAGAAGGASGVLIGGALTEYLNWRWVLLINVPIVVLAFAAGREVPDGRPAQRPRLDLVGALLATSGLAALVYGVVRTGTDGWTSAATLLTFGLAAVLLTAFTWQELRRAKEPLVRLGLLARRAVGGANVTMLLLASGQFASFYFVSLYLQRILDYGPAVTGLAFLPFCVGFTASALLSSRLYVRTGPRALVVAGTAAGALGLLWFSRIDIDGTFLGSILGPSLLTSLGIGACFVPLASAATTGGVAGEAGMASGVLNSAQQVGGSLGLAVTASVATSRTDAARGDGDGALAALNHGYGTALLVAACLLAAAALLSWVLPGRQPGPAADTAGAGRAAPEAKG
ncbi:MFS transporter [Streptomyces zagrosensis]|uniref:EmrB/QacA subfamily drug resistance transporter n=1 Tax=Streptomyces zagrosensis TaxID=1042984 RepID=A0A7W9QF41_9ACTN|nr:MFS transporter [Streptomyces zagrosensis]MBB5937867.1 EmrB/QacA subfamily drug resistance transporter [Streptomyces zagrosensis]